MSISLLNAALRRPPFQDGGNNTRRNPPSEEKKREAVQSRFTDEEHKDPDDMGWAIVVPQKDRKNAIPVNPHSDCVGKHPFRAQVSGSSGSGKTTLIRHLYDKCWADYFDKIYIFSPSINIDDTWKNLKKKPTKVFTTFEEHQIDNIIEGNEKIVENQGVDKAPKILIIVDDFASEKKATRSPVLRRVAFNTRHANISSLFCTQAYNKYDPDLRKNLSILFVFRPSNNKETDSLCDEQAISLLSRAQFKQMLVDATNEKYSFMTINHQTEKQEHTYRKGLTQVMEINVAVAAEQANDRSSSLRKRKKQGQDSTTSRQTTLPYITSEPPSKKQRVT